MQEIFTFLAGSTLLVGCIAIGVFGIHMSRVDTNRFRRGYFLLAGVALILYGVFFLIPDLINLAQTT